MTTAPVNHAGSDLPPPIVDRWHQPRGEVTWLDADTAAVCTSGPSLALSVDLYAPHAAGRTQVAVARVLDGDGYLPTSNPDWQDATGLLAASTTLVVPAGGAAERVPILLPYTAFPPGTGGAIQVEIALHEPTGQLTAVSRFPVELPPDVDRSPDLLTVTAHTLVALCRSPDGGLSRDEVRVIRTLLCENFQLDELGDLALMRILKTAAHVRHTPETLAEVLGLVLPTSAHERFVNLLYACARADGGVEVAEQGFIDELLRRLDIHDHQRFGPASLRPCFEELELEPGADAEAVKKAYKRLVRDYHPDRVQNLPRGFREYANRKVAALNDAYQRIRVALERKAVAVVEVDDGIEAPNSRGR